MPHGPTHDPRDTNGDGIVSASELVAARKAAGAVATAPAQTEIFGTVTVRNGVPYQAIEDSVTGRLLGYVDPEGNRVSALPAEIPKPSTGSGVSPATGASAYTEAEVVEMVAADGGTLRNYGGVLVATFPDGAQVQFDPSGGPGGVIRFNATFKPPPAKSLTERYEAGPSGSIIDKATKQVAGQYVTKNGVTNLQWRPGWGPNGYGAGATAATAGSIPSFPGVGAGAGSLPDPRRGLTLTPEGGITSGEIQGPQGGLDEYGFPQGVPGEQSAWWEGNAPGAGGSGKAAYNVIALRERIAAMGAQLERAQAAETQAQMDAPMNPTLGDTMRSQQRAAQSGPALAKLKENLESSKARLAQVEDLKLKKLVFDAEHPNSWTNPYTTALNLLMAQEEVEKGQARRAAAVNPNPRVFLVNGQGVMPSQQALFARKQREAADLAAVAAAEKEKEEANKKQSAEDAKSPIFSPLPERAPLFQQPSVPAFKHGGTYMADEKIIGVEADSGKPRFIAGEAGDENISFDPVEGANADMLKLDTPGQPRRPQMSQPGVTSPEILRALARGINARVALSLPAGSVA